MTFQHLVPWYAREEEPFHSMQKELEKLFNLAPFEKLENSFVPKIDVKETQKDIQVSAELPGMDEKDIDVSLHEGTLIVKGEKKSETENEKDGYHRIERSYGSFYRSIDLPEGIEEDKIKANYKKGVLKVVLPKNAKAQKKQKKIEVKAA